MLCTVLSVCVVDAMSGWKRWQAGYTPQFYQTLRIAGWMCSASKFESDLSRPPTMHAFLKTVAQLGGFIDKKSQRSPAQQRFGKGRDDLNQ